MATIGIVDIGATLERHTIVASTIEVCGGVEIMYLFRLNTSNSIVIHLRQDVRILLTSTNSCRSDKMGILSESLSEEHLIAGTHYSTIVEIDIIYKQPCADAVISKGASLLGQLHVIHALCDALLGALALGDIGQHFPDTSDDYAGIDSRILLSRVAAMVREKGWEIVNVDNTLLAQKPKIAPYVPAMRQALADTLGLPVEAVSVKATTTERLGFVGREEGVAAYATCLLRRG